MPLKFVNASDACAVGQGDLKRADLCVVGGDEKKVLQCQWSGDAVLVGVETSMEFVVNRRDPFNFFVTLLNVAIVLHAAEQDPAFTGNETVGARRDQDFLPGAIGM